MINHNPNANAESNPNPMCESVYEKAKADESKPGKLTVRLFFH